MTKKILIADDKEVTANLLQRSLKIAGYEVIVARTGLEALNMAEKEQPDLIILDILMPEIDGYSVNLKLKENDKTKNIPVIISTTRTKMAELFESSGKAKINGFIEKPYTIEELWSEVKKILGE